MFLNKDSKVYFIIFSVILFCGEVRSENQCIDYFLIKANVDTLVKNKKYLNKYKVGPSPGWITGCGTTAILEDNKEKEKEPVIRKLAISRKSLFLVKMDSCKNEILQYTFHRNKSLRDRCEYEECFSIKKLSRLFPPDTVNKLELYQHYTTGAKPKRIKEPLKYYLHLFKNIQMVTMISTYGSEGPTLSHVYFQSANNRDSNLFKTLEYGFDSLLFHHKAIKKDTVYQYLGKTKNDNFKHFSTKPVTQRMILRQFSFCFDFAEGHLKENCWRFGQVSQYQYNSETFTIDYDFKVNSLGRKGLVRFQFRTAPQGWPHLRSLIFQALSKPAPFWNASGAQKGNHWVFKWKPSYKKQNSNYYKHHPHPDFMPKTYFFYNKKVLIPNTLKVKSIVKLN
jgi:hypothetical protein